MGERGPACGWALARVEAHAAAYHLDPENIRMTTPLARLHIWALAAAERRGENTVSGETLDILDEVAAAGGVAAWLEINRE